MFLKNFPIRGSNVSYMFLKFIAILYVQYLFTKKPLSLTTCTRFFIRKIQKLRNFYYILFWNKMLIFFLIFITNWMCISTFITLLFLTSVWGNDTQFINHQWNMYVPILLRNCIFADDFQTFHHVVKFESVQNVRKFFYY